MNLKEILAISGKPGLYQLVAQSKSGVIVQSLSDEKRFPISAQNNVSALADIAIYTYDAEKPLQEIFKSIFDREEGKACMSHKESKNAIFTYFGEIVEGFDDERVYVSDMKKVLQWYNILIEHNILNFDEESEETAVSEESNESEVKED